MPATAEQKLMKAAMANLSNAVSSGLFIESGTGTKFWIPDVAGKVALPVLVMKSANADNPQIYFVTPKVKNAKGEDVSLTVSLGELYEDVQSIEDSKIGTQIIVDVYPRSVNPALKLSDIDATSNKFKLEAEARGETYVDRFSTIRKALVARDTGVGASMSYILAEFE